MPPSHAPPTISPSIARMKNTISLILLHSTYLICQQILLALPSKYSQNLATSHCHPCPSHDPSTAGFLHPLRSPCDCPCCLGSIPNTATWKSDHVTPLPKVLPISLRVKAAFSAAYPRTWCNPIPSLVL